MTEQASTSDPTDTTAQETRRARALLDRLYQAAVTRALPAHVTAACLPSPPGPGGRTLVLGAGKAGAAMAQAVEAAWPADAPLSGLVVTRYHHVPPRAAGLAARIEVVEASHPVPDEAGQQAALQLEAAAGVADAGLGGEELEGDGLAGDLPVSRPERDEEHPSVGIGQVDLPLRFRATAEEGIDPG